MAGRKKAVDKQAELVESVSTAKLCSLKSDGLENLRFRDADFSKEDFIQVLRKCAKGIHPEIAMKGIGKFREYLFLLTCSKAMPDSDEAKQLYVLDSYYNQAIGQLMEHTFNHALSEDGRVSISATKLLMEIAERLDSTPKPMVIKNRS